ncbi:MAG: tetratricopeptide repeat protein [Geobacteraceae bacterium]
MNSILNSYKAIKEKIRGRGPERNSQLGVRTDISLKCAAAGARGVDNFHLDRYHQAIKEFDKSIGENPKDANAYNNRGTANLNLTNYQQAINDFTNAITINPNFAEAYHGRGVANDKLGNKQQAIKDFDKTIEVDPKHRNAFFHRGQVYFTLGNYHLAIKDNDRVIELDPNLAEAYFGRGVVNVKLGELTQAINDFDKAIEINPKYVEAHRVRKVAKSELARKQAELAKKQAATMRKRNSAMQSEAALAKNRILKEEAEIRIKKDLQAAAEYIASCTRPSDRRQRQPLRNYVKKYVWNRDGGCCVECASKEKLEYDHIIPHSKGGSDTERNIQLLCEKCNRSKHAKI